MTATVRTRCGRCDAWNSFEADDRIDAVECGACAQPIGLAGVSERLLAGGPVDRCARCGAADFWTHKDFPKALGIGIVVLAAIVAFWTYGISLVVAAILDAALYPCLPWVTVCYRCKSEYRGLPRDAAHGGFDLAHQEDVEADEADRARGPAAPGPEAAPCPADRGAP
jgi:hypothetical protein